MSLPRGLQVVGELFGDVWRWGFSEPPLLIDMKRVNVELRKEALVGLDDDVDYRNRVKQRIREGAGCGYPPLIDRKKVLQFATILRGEGRGPAANTAGDSLAEAG
jgi:hypothetical protein